MPRQRTTVKPTGGGGGGGNANTYPYTITCDGSTTVFNKIHTLGTVNISATILQSANNLGQAPYTEQYIPIKVINSTTVQYDLEGLTIEAGFTYKVTLTAQL